MNMKNWAENEVKIACKKENPNWDGKTFDYGCACYQSALKAYKFMLDDNHSGFSWQITSNILKRLLDTLPLTPIKDEDFVQDPSMPQSSEEELKDRKLKSDIQCPRMPSLFRQEKLDGTVTYNDVERTIFVDTYNKDHPSTWHSGEADKIVDKLFPITMPYYPSTKQYKVYGKSMYVDENGNDKTKEHPGTFNKTIYEYLITPEGEKIELNIIKTC